MIIPTSPTLRFMRRKLLLSVAGSLLGLVMSASAAEQGSVGSARVLDSVEVDLGPRSITYNRVEPPVLKPQPTPAPVSPAWTEAPPTAEELAALQEWNAKADVYLFLSCTVYDKSVTEVHWHREDGEYVFWSGIDFNHLRGVFGFETGTARYTLIMGLGDESSEFLEGITLPKLTSSQYQVVKFPATGIAPEVTAALHELHGYYTANKVQFAREFEEAEAARQEQEAWLRANPPVPKDSVIHYFPIRSSQNGNAGGSR